MRRETEEAEKKAVGESRNWQCINGEKKKLRAAFYCRVLFTAASLGFLYARRELSKKRGRSR